MGHVRLGKERFNEMGSYRLHSISQKYTVGGPEE